MTKAPLVAAILLILAGCTTTANLKATPLKEQSAVQVESDRKRCDEWSKVTAAVLAGFAACLVAGGYETTPEVGSTSQPVRLARVSPAPDPTRVLLEVLDCAGRAPHSAGDFCCSPAPASCRSPSCPASVCTSSDSSTAFRPSASGSSSPGPSPRPKRSATSSAGTAGLSTGSSRSSTPTAGAWRARGRTKKTWAAR